MTTEPPWYTELRRIHGPWGPMPVFRVFFLDLRGKDVRDWQGRWEHMWWNVACMHYHSSRAELGLW